MRLVNGWLDTRYLFWLSLGGGRRPRLSARGEGLHPKCLEDLQQAPIQGQSMLQGVENPAKDRKQRQRGNPLWTNALEYLLWAQLILCYDPGINDLILVPRNLWFTGKGLERVSTQGNSCQLVDMSFQSLSFLNKNRKSSASHGNFVVV